MRYAAIAVTTAGRDPMAITDDAGIVQQRVGP
jgi:hypothetical protein